MNCEQARASVLTLLQAQGRAKNSELLALLGCDRELLEQVREDLIFQDLAKDKPLLAARALPPPRHLRARDRRVRAHGQSGLAGGSGGADAARRARGADGASGVAGVAGVADTVTSVCSVSARMERVESRTARS